MTEIELKNHKKKILREANYPNSFLLKNGDIVLAINSRPSGYVTVEAINGKRSSVYFTEFVKKINR
jgi:hypothetical protein